MQKTNTSNFQYKSLTLFSKQYVTRRALGHVLIVLFIIACLVSGSLSAQQGLKAEYYDGKDFDKKVATRIDQKIDFYWDLTPPVEGIDPHVCSIRWTGKLKAPKTGKYSFSALVDDGIRVWVGSQLVIDDWNLNDVGRFQGKVEMIAGKSYDFKVEYFNALNEAEITLLWTMPDPKKSWFKKLLYEGKKEVISPEYFYLPTEKDVAVVEPVQPTKQVQKQAAPKTQPIMPKKVIESAVVEAKIVEPKIEPVMAEEITAEVIQKYTPKNIQFDRAKHDILPESFSELDELASFLARNDQLRLSIEGHTDNVGNADKNLRLSQRRAIAIARYLVKKGIKGTRIKAEGFGGTKPLVPSEDGVYHPQNRRVEFIITGDEDLELVTVNK